MPDPSESVLGTADLEFVCDFVRNGAAIDLNLDKAYLINTRLEPLVRKHGFGSLENLVAELRKSTPAGGLGEEAIDAITTNETSFFRDFHPFEAMREHIIPKIMEKRRAQQALNLWCAASSSGQEPYSIAMLLREHFPALESWNLTFIASDISRTMLSRCREGRYTKLEVNRGLPVPMLIKYFEEEDGGWRIKKELRDMVRFQHVNLIQPWSLLPRMDIIFMRNVLIYFDIDTRKGILTKIQTLLRSDGYVFLGSTETPLTLDAGLESASVPKSSCYCLVDQTANAPGGAASSEVASG